MILLGEEATALSPRAYLPARNERWVDKRDRISSFLNFQHKIFVLKFYVIGKEKKKKSLYVSFSSFRQNRMSNADGREISNFAT